MLQRATVLIGVKKTGGLPTLNAVQKGIDQMKAWAAAQPGMTDPNGVPRIEILSDENGDEVTAAAVRRAIKKFVDDGTIEQLIVYFAGHGANVNYNEYWLLSGAPEVANEAVNVEGSKPIARQCGIPHVVLISDACRTAAASIQSQAVQGSIVFPNKPPGPAPGCVDVFYATLVGQPALEVSNAAAAQQFDAVYTLGLVEGLGGAAPVVSEQDGPETVRRVKPRPLKKYLAAAVPTLVMQRVGFAATQTPDAIITSEDDAWLAQLPPAAGTGATRGGTTRGGAPGGTRGGPPGPPGPPLPGEATPGLVAPPSLSTASQAALRAALRGEALPTGESTGRTRGGTRGATRGGTAEPPIGVAEEMFNKALARAHGDAAPGHFESGCGFKVNGTIVKSVVTGTGRVDLFDDAKDLVRIWNVPRPATNALIVFDDGNGALVPAIPDFIGTLTYDDGELANVSYEPSDRSPQWTAVRDQLAELRALRRVVAAAARLGVFRPDDIEDLNGFVRRLRDVKGLDPTLAVYAAYALHTLQRQKTIDEMQGDLEAALQLRLFDIAMLAREPGTRKAWNAAKVFPAIPLLSQGWALLDPYRVSLPGSLGDAKLYRCLKSSLWTLFTKSGVTAVRKAITSKEIG